MWEGRAHVSWQTCSETQTLGTATGDSLVTLLQAPSHCQPIFPTERKECGRWTRSCRAQCTAMSASGPRSIHLGDVSVEATKGGTSWEWVVDSFRPFGFPASVSVPGWHWALCRLISAQQEQQQSFLSGRAMQALATSALRSSAFFLFSLILLTIQLLLCSPLLLLIEFLISSFLLIS
jgi:hypothetical protein